MYLVEVTHNDETICKSYQDLLSDSVDIANQSSYKGCVVRIYECIKSLDSYETIAKVLSWEDDGVKI
jgi:hypothetical protein|tara:strand:- start:288 stop:488 length:201 start_codon:yes stop_codon:yes gene_type:complete